MKITKRREWHAQVDKNGYLRCRKDGCGVRMDWQSLFVREVLPGDPADLDELIAAARAITDEWDNPYKSYAPERMDECITRVRKALEPGE